MRKRKKKSIPRITGGYPPDGLSSFQLCTWPPQRFSSVCRTSTRRGQLWNDLTAFLATGCSGKIVGFSLSSATTATQLSEICKVINAMRVYNHSYWLAIFWPGPGPIIAAPQFLRTRCPKIMKIISVYLSIYLSIYLIYLYIYTYVYIYI